MCFRNKRIIEKVHIILLKENLVLIVFDFAFLRIKSWLTDMDNPEEKKRKRKSPEFSVISYCHTVLSDIFKYVTHIPTSRTMWLKFFLCLEHCAAKISDVASLSSSFSAAKLLTWSERSFHIILPIIHIIPVLSFCILSLTFFCFLSWNLLLPGIIYLFVWIPLFVQFTFASLTPSTVPGSQ